METENKELRKVKVTYSNGVEIATSMASHLTDTQILEYFKVGRWFNIGAVNDDMQQVVKVELLDKPNYKQLLAELAEVGLKEKFEVELAPLFVSNLSNAKISSVANLIRCGMAYLENQNSESWLFWQAVLHYFLKPVWARDKQDLPKIA